MRSVKLIKNQAVAAGKNRLQSGVADLRKQTGIVNSASRLLGEVATGKEKIKKEREVNDGVYVRRNNQTQGYWDYSELLTAADGYVRLTPVQELKVGENYRKNIIKKIVAAAAIVLVVVLVIVTVYKLKLFSM